MSNDPRSAEGAVGAFRYWLNRLKHLTWKEALALAVPILIVMFVGIMALPSNEEGPSSRALAPAESALTTAPAGTIWRSDYGDEWPFNVESVVLHCDVVVLGMFSVWVEHDGGKYPINGVSRTHLVPQRSTADIRASDPNAPGLSISVGPIIQDGLELCESSIDLAGDQPIVLSADVQTKDDLVELIERARQGLGQCLDIANDGRSQLSQLMERINTGVHPGEPALAEAILTAQSGADCVIRIGDAYVGWLDRYHGNLLDHFDYEMLSSLRNEAVWFTLRAHELLGSVDDVENRLLKRGILSQ